MKINYMKLLTETVQEMPAVFDIRILHQGCGNTKIEFEDFKADLLDFLKKKRIKEFIVDENRLCIKRYANLEVIYLFRFFKLGVDVETINSHILYDSWKQRDEKTYEEFTKEFKNMLAHLKRDTTGFTFNDIYTFQKYTKEK